MKKLSDNTKLICSAACFVLAIIWAILINSYQSQINVKLRDYLSLLIVLLFIFSLLGIIVFGIKSIKQDKKKAIEVSEEEIKRQQDLSEKIHKEIEEWTCVYLDNVDISLPKDEHCLASYDVAVYKDKYVSQKVWYSWLSYRIKIAKWLSYRVWTISPSINREKVTYLDDQWTIYLTNERMIIKLSKKVDSIKYSKILSVEMIPWWAIVYKDSWAPKVFNFKSEFETFPIYVDALINKSNS